MGKEVEMVDADLAPVKKQSPEAPKENVPKATAAELRLLVPLLDKAVASKEVRLMARAVRQVMVLRKRWRPSHVATFVRDNLPAEAEATKKLQGFLAMAQESSGSMDVDGAAAAAAVAAVAVVPAAPAKGQPAPLPELEALCYLMVTLLLLDAGKVKEARDCSAAAVERLQLFNRRTLDIIAARIYFFYSLTHEKLGVLAEIRGFLLALHRTATLRHDEAGQEVLLNLLLRNYLHYNLYDQAEKLRSKTQRPESHSNQQLCRYLYYLGRIRTIQLEYTDARDCLAQAARKAPTCARGFRIACTKWGALVRLLLGEIPERTQFMQAGMRNALRPYFELSNAVRIGDLQLFQRVVESHSPVFAADKTANLIVRLRQNVIRAGLRRINVAYSKISLADVAAKLHLTGSAAVEDAESIVAKAIRDGGIDAALDHGAGTMLSREAGDVYSSAEPQQAFHKRVAFCLNVHNEAVKAMRFPPNTHGSDLESAEKRRERHQQEQELAKQISDEDDEEF